MSTLTVTLALPPAIEAGLHAGTLEQVGGVIRRSTGKREIVTWLREVSTGQHMPNPGSPLGGATQVFQAVGTVAAVLNLGATVGFGMATLGAIAKTQKQLADGFADVGASLNQMRADVLGGLDRVLAGQEEILAEFDASQRREAIQRLRSANRQLASLVGLNREEEATRRSVIDNEVCRAAEQLRHLAERSISSGASSLTVRKGRSRLSILDGELSALIDVREGLLAADLRARILADSGQLEAAARDAEVEAQHARRLLMALSEAFFGDGTVWDELLNEYWAEAIGPERVDRFARTFDAGGTGSLAGVIRLLYRARENVALAVAAQAEAVKKAGREPDEIGELREKLKKSTFSVFEGPAFQRDTSHILDKLSAELRVREVMFVMQSHQVAVRTGGVTGLAEHVQWEEAALNRLIPFLDLLEGVAVDVERLLGRAAEYHGIADAGSDLRAHAERFVRVDLSPDVRQRIADGDELDAVFYVDDEAVARVLRTSK